MQTETRKTRPRNRRLKRTVAIVLQCAAAALAVVAAMSAVSFWPGGSRGNAADSRFKEAATESKALRPVYPYSVIRGGAYTPSELKDKLASDEIAARHYEAFDLSRIVVTKADSARPVYVSYRKGESIYWTRRPVQLHKDEPLLTDGVLFARARCGNRISDSPQKPVAETPEDEPSPNIFDVPESWEPAAPSKPQVASGIQSLPALVPSNASESSSSKGSSISTIASQVCRAPQLWLPGLGVPIIGGAPSAGDSSLPSIALLPDPGLPDPPDAGSGQGTDSYPIPNPFLPHPPGAGRGPFTGRPTSPSVVTPPSPNPPDQTPPSRIPSNGAPPSQDLPPFTSLDNPPTSGQGPMPPPGPPDQDPPGYDPLSPPKDVPPDDPDGPGSPPEAPG